MKDSVEKNKSSSLMKDILSQEVLDDVGRIIREETGIVLSKGKATELEIVLRSRLVVTNMELFEYIDFIKKDHEEMILLASSFTIQETSFYRYKSHYDRLKLDILPILISERKEINNKNLRILSAGSATGEEPYTIAMIIKELINDLDEWNIVILGTDINENAINLAKEGIYSDYKLRNIDQMYIDKYFSKVKKVKSDRTNYYVLSEDIKKLVTFRKCNLIKEPFELSYLSNVDIIFCENVMIYFCKDSIQRLINNFYNILRMDGYLFIGYSETLNTIEHNFSLSWWHESFGYQKLDKVVETDSINRSFIPKLDSVIIKEVSDIIENIGNVKYDTLIDKIIKICNYTSEEEVMPIFKSIEESNIKLDERYYIIKAEYLFSVNNYINASNECRKAINVNPHVIDAHILLSAIYLDLNMLESAEFEIRTSLYLNKESILANYYFGEYYKKIEENGEYSSYVKLASDLLKNNKGELKESVFPILIENRHKILTAILDFK